MADEEDDYDDDEGTAEIDDGEPEEGGGSKGSKKKLILIIVLPLLLAIGAAAGAYFTGLADPLLAMLGAAPTDQAAEDGPAEPGTPPVFYDLQEMLVNLNTTARKKTYLKIRVSLELAKQEDMMIVEGSMPRVIDNFQVYLRELRVEDLQGAAGMYRLREELLRRVNVAVKPAKVKDVLFKEMLIQ